MLFKYIYILLIKIHITSIFAKPMPRKVIAYLKIQTPIFITIHKNNISL